MRAGFLLGALLGALTGIPGGLILVKLIDNATCPTVWASNCRILTGRGEAHIIILTIIVSTIVGMIVGALVDRHLRRKRLIAD